MRKRPYYITGAVPETPAPSEQPEPWGETRVVGQPQPRIDAYERVSGAAVYPSDLQLPDMLYAAILRCPHPHARVLEVDLSRAAVAPGVVALLGPESPEAQLDWYYSRASKTKLLENHCRHEGEAVAAVAAETPEEARDALALITVDYEALPFVTDVGAAFLEDAPKIYESGNRVGETAVYSRGDIEAGFAEADAVVRREFSTATQIHSAIEPHGCVARWDGERLTIWESTQGVYGVQGSVARILGLPLSSVRIIGEYVGGAFGAKLQPGKYTILAALLARMTARPVKLFLSREETFLSVGNRPPNRMTLEAGVRKDGTLTALRFEGSGTGGAYPTGGTGLLDWLVRDLYRCENVTTKRDDVFVNAGPSRPFRAPGHPQGAWALEQVMDELAGKIGMDPLELRLRNIPEESQANSNKPYTSTGLRRCLIEGAQAFGWGKASEPDAKPHLRRGVGLAACLWIAGAGGPPATVVLKLFRDGSANLNFGASDLGTGTKTVMAMIVGEELGIDSKRIQIEHADTATTQFATPSGGSKTIPTESPAVRDAALAVKRQLLKIAAEELELPAEQLVLRDGAVFSRADETKRREFGQLQGLARQGVIVGVGYRGENPADKVTCPFGAQFCEVELNTLTGEVRVLRFLGAHDSGRVMNRLSFDSQVFGGIVMGMGFGMSEERILDHEQSGRMLNANWQDYAIPTMADVPLEMISLPIEVDDPEANTVGAKGLGEPVTIPTAAAIANAVHDAAGLRLGDAPLTPERLLVALEAKRSRKEA